MSLEITMYEVTDARQVRVLLPRSPLWVVWVLQDGCTTVPPRGGESCPVLRGEDELSARWGAGNVSSRPERGKTVHTHPSSVYRRGITLTHINNGQLMGSVWLSAAFSSWSMNASAASRALRLAWNGMIWDFSCRQISGGFSRLPWVRYRTLPRWIYRGCEPLWRGWQQTAMHLLFYSPSCLQSVVVTILFYFHQCCMVVNETCAVTNSL